MGLDSGEEGGVGPGLVVDEGGEEVEHGGMISVVISNPPSLVTPGSHC